MSTLYSALSRAVPSAKRGNPLALLRALSCIYYLRPLLNKYRGVAIDRLSADQCDVLSTVMFKWSTLPIFGGPRWLLVAEAVVTSVLKRRDAPKAHTQALLLLTLVRILLVRGKKSEAKKRHAEVATLIPHISDLNQKARVYRGCAEIVVGLEGAHGKEKARKYLDLADALPGIDDDVRVKTSEMRRVLGI